MLELIAAAAVGVTALVLVLEPLLRPSSTPAADPAADEPVPLEETGAPKVRALLALKEIEFDRATGKLSDEDYAHLKSRYEAEALAAIRAEEAAARADEGRLAPAPAAAPDAPGDAVEALIRRARTARPGCPAHGPRPEGDAIFCSECGRTLTAV